LRGESVKGKDMHSGDLRRTLQVLWSASGWIFRDRGALKRFFHRLRYLLRVAPDVNVLSTLVNGTGNETLAREMADSHALIKAMSNPYIHSGWSLERRLVAVHEHYRAVSSGPAALLDFPSKCYWDCATIDLQGRQLRIVMDRPYWMRAEGEVAVSLFLDSDRVYVAAFSLHGEWPRCKLVIGAIQGRRDADTKNVYAELTSSLHGMRPRDLMVHVVKMVARSIGCTEILAISNEFHQLSKSDSTSRKQLDYDEIWSEDGGAPNAEGFYVLPPDIRKREVADIPSRKRAQYKRRYALLDELQNSVYDAFHGRPRTLQTH
jgi:uncharacterized protein VirK/YbjX